MSSRLPLTRLFLVCSLKISPAKVANQALVSRVAEAHAEMLQSIVGVGVGVEIVCRDFCRSWSTSAIHSQTWSSSPRCLRDGPAVKRERRLVGQAALQARPQITITVSTASDGSTWLLVAVLVVVVVD